MQGQDSDALQTELASIRDRFEASQKELSSVTSQLSSNGTTAAEIAELTKQLRLARETADSQSNELDRLKAEWSSCDSPQRRCRAVETRSRRAH